MSSKKTIAYARASSADQKEDVVRQMQTCFLAHNINFTEEEFESEGSEDQETAPDLIGEGDVSFPPELLHNLKVLSHGDWRNEIYMITHDAEIPPFFIYSLE